MGGTTWIPMSRMEPRSWLLGTGEVVTEPALEMTATGRKIRVAGEKTSAYHYDLDAMLDNAVNLLAESKQTDVWIETTTPPREVVAEYAGYDPDITKARLHLIHAPTDPHARTIVWWRFKDSKSPYEVLLTVAMNSTNRGTVLNQVVTTSLTMVDRDYGNIHGAVNIQTENFRALFSDALLPDDQIVWTEFVRDNPPDWPANLLGTETHNHARLGINALIKAVREIDSYDEIQVPDLGDRKHPSWRTLELYETNYNESLMSDLAEYLDGAPTIEQAADLYKQLVETLRTCGIVFEAKVENDFQAALVAGDKASLSVKVFNLAEAEHKVDDRHALSIHLPTGAFIVECTHREIDRNEVAEKWEEAMTMASLTGQEPELLAYARAYARDHSATRTKKILAERRAGQ